MFKKKVHQRPKYLNTDNLDAEALQIIGIIATSRKVTCSIPDGVIGIFYWNKSPGSIMTMG
jgi:hypothetical protein